MLGIAARLGFSCGVSITPDSQIGRCMDLIEIVFYVVIGIALIVSGLLVARL